MVHVGQCEILRVLARHVCDEGLSRGILGRAWELERWARRE